MSTQSETPTATGHNNDSQPTNQRPPIQPPPRILCLWLPEWPIQRLVVTAPQYRQQCVVLVRTDPKSGKRVAAASPLARRQGIRADMPLAEAQSLLNYAAAQDPQCQSFIRVHDRAADLEALQQLAWALERFSPVIGLEQDFTQTDQRKQQKNSPQFSPSSLLMDVTGLSHLFGSFESLACQVRQWCMDLGYLVHVAIADTLGLAWGAAHFHPDCRHDRPWVIHEAHATAFDTIQNLPICALRIPPQTSQTLQRLGIKTIGQLTPIDRGDLRSRLGADLLKRLDQMTGAVDEPIATCKQQADFSVTESLEYATNHRETIEVVVGRLVTDLCQQLKTQQLGGLQWLIRLIPQVQHTSAPARAAPHPVEIRVNLFQPTADHTHVMPMVAMQLEQALQPHLTAHDWKKAPLPNSPSASNAKPSNRATPKSSGRQRYTRLQFQSIAVEIASCVRQIARQRQLFDEMPGLNEEALAGLINRLSIRLGATNVVSPKLRKGAQPEFSVRFKPLVDPLNAQKKPRRSSVKPTAPPPAFSHQMGRPLRLIHPPVPVDVQRVSALSNEVAKEIAFRAPAQIALSSRHVNQTPQTITRSWGPERIETGWWRGVMVRRDYWRIVTAKGLQYWIFCDLKTQHWFLHGEF